MKFVKQEFKSFVGHEPDLVVMSIFMEMDDLALALFHSNKVIEENIWLYLEILMINRRYLEVLSLLPAIEKGYSDSPDTFLACTFLRSISLWNLGEKNSAIEVLQAVVEIKPNYRSSDVLLAEWSQS